jgi:thymidylate synthase (FAD)
MKTKLIWITPNPEDIIMYTARVSNPEHQDSGDVRLIKYCIRKNEWSIFQMANACFEVVDCRAITRQSLRHQSFDLPYDWEFNYQEFSQRYAKVMSFEQYKARRQDKKNRQNSIDDMSEEVVKWFYDAQIEVQQFASHRYETALEKGIAKEQARFLLPEGATSTLYMNGTIRSWIHYINVRCGDGVQKEHQDIAFSIREELSKHLPTIAEALDWTTP